MDSLSAVLVLAGLVLAVLVGYALAAARRPPAPEADPAAVERIREALDRLDRGQEQFRLEAQRGREDALVGLAGAAQDLQGRLAQAQRALAEVKALEQARGSQLDRATDSLQAARARGGRLRQPRGGGRERPRARPRASCRRTCWR